MKIYFEDGLLRDKYQLPDTINYMLDASYGITSNIDFLNLLLKREDKENLVIYTNSIAAFSNKYAWNEKLKVPEIYIRAGEYMLFTRIDRLTDRELKEGHNLSKMYLSGEFEEYTNYMQER